MPRYRYRLHIEPCRKASGNRHGAAKRRDKNRSAKPSARNHIPHRPQIRPQISSPRTKPPRLVLPLSAFSPRFKADLARYRANRGLKPPSRLPRADAPRLLRLRLQSRVSRGGKLLAPLAPKTLNDHLYTALRAASALGRAGKVDPRKIRGLADVVTIDGAAALTDELLGELAPMTNFGRKCVWNLRSAAIRWRPDISAGELLEFTELAAELVAATPRQITPQSRDRIAPFTPAVLATIASIPRRTMAQVNGMWSKNGRCSVSFSDAVRARQAIGILLALRLCPPRGALAAAHLDRNFVWCNGKATVLFTKTETKTRHDLRADLTVAETRMLHLYEIACLPSLAGPGNRHIFAARRGSGTLCPESVTQLIRARILLETGCKINLNIFRALLATVLLSDDPQHGAYAAALLGHAPDNSTVRRFIDLQSRWAHVAVRAAIDSQMKWPRLASRKVGSRPQSDGPRRG